MNQLDNNINRVNHILTGSRGSDHHWQQAVPDLNVDKIKDLVCKTMISGSQVGDRAKELIWQGNTIHVTYNDCNGFLKIGDGWIKP